MTEEKSFEDLEALNEQYLKEHPKAEPLTNFFSSYGIDGIFELYAEANGREIILEWGEGEDNSIVSFK